MNPRRTHRMLRPQKTATHGNQSQTLHEPKGRARSPQRAVRCGQPHGQPAGGGAPALPNCVLGSWPVSRSEWNKGLSMNLRSGCPAMRGRKSVLPTVGTFPTLESSLHFCGRRRPHPGFIAPTHVHFGGLASMNRCPKELSFHAETRLMECGARRRCGSKAPRRHGAHSTAPPRHSSLIPRHSSLITRHSSPAIP